MANEQEIKSEKILVKDIFSTMWFRIPEYQRPYIWSRDEVDDLLDDLTFAQVEKPDTEYFLGSFVFQSKPAGTTDDQEFDENDLLDGQQRMTTLLMLFACIRDLATEENVRTSCQKSIFQKGDDIDEIPERTRIVFSIRKEVQDFVDEFVKADGGTNREADLERLAAKSEDPSIPNMARAILEMRRYLQDPEANVQLGNFLRFLRNRVLLIYISTEDLDDAFRLFTILNARGVPLRNSDILKSMNLGALPAQDEAAKARFAKLWEDAEGELGDDFDRFLNHLRTILLKDKARLNLLQEFEDKIYSPKEKDKSTSQKKPALLEKGKPTFQFIERYLKYYSTLLGGGNYDDTGSTFEFDNLIKVMVTGLPSSDWIPPLLRYFDRFKHDRLLDFLVLLDNKFSSDWIAQYTPTERIENMNEVIRVIEAASTSNDVLQNKCFNVDGAGVIRAVDGPVYGRRFTRYLLIKLDFLYHDHAHRMAFESLSVEHVLPQKPSTDSQWRADFSDEQRKDLTNRIGNLVLITTKKNTSQGNADYDIKRTKYFAKKINTCPNSLRVLQSAKWTPLELLANQKTVIAKICQHYEIVADAA
ncbi:DUF262 domain-containing protein [Burkholderia ambifaria]|uniref:DUF262 domain-containing protein n=1 Tax=Burkholderia ambifaria TaxID=152480 RepID=UPI001C935017|nr:DUF262 domain-containing protein [Burkholderia ambifaria]MBY4766728.1 DUF262 domain-containing HNH endonuclease family protein [Burkholderia ambifaria]